MNSVKENDRRRANLEDVKLETVSSWIKVVRSFIEKQIDCQT